MMELNINGKSHVLDVDADAPLMWVLREKLGLTSVKLGCGVGACGACTVHIDGVAQRSCMVPLASAAQRNIATLEGLPQKIGGATQALANASTIVESLYRAPFLHHAQMEPINRGPAWTLDRLSHPL